NTFPFSARLSQHRNERWRTTYLDRAENFETVALIQRNVPGVGGFQVCRQMVPITRLEGVCQERRAITSALVRRIYTNKRQIPMRSARMVTRHLLKHYIKVVTSGGCDGTLHNLAERFLIGMHIGRQPERCASMVFAAMGTVV